MNGTYTNPVVGNNAPDPGVFFDEETGVYWMVSTSGDSPNAFPIRSSKDLVRWKLEGYAFPQNRRPSWAKSDFWAPEIHKLFDGSFVLYFTARSNASGCLSVGVATLDQSADDLAGPWIDSGSPLITNKLGAIDATFYANESSNYIIWKVDGNSVGAPTTIYAQSLTPDGLSVSPGSEAVGLINNSLPWEGPLVEAPWIIERAGFFYLFYSGQGYASSRYAIGVARSSSLFGPYEKSQVPILSYYPLDGKFYGPGHCSVVPSPANNAAGSSGNFSIVYHAWISNGSARVVLVDRLSWDENGWPVVGDCGSPTQTAQPLPPGAPANPKCPYPKLSGGPIAVFDGAQGKRRAWEQGDDKVILGNDSISLIVKQGLIGGASVSFQSSLDPSMHIRQRDGSLRLENRTNHDGSLYASDASFWMRPAANNTRFYIKSFNYPFNYISSAEEFAIDLRPFSGNASEWLFSAAE